jgi:acetyl-CoA hydrolase
VALFREHPWELHPSSSRWPTRQEPGHQICTRLIARKIIIEVNTSMPSFEGLHDITMTDLPPRRKPFLIMAPEDRIGTNHIPVDPEKVVALVESDYPDQTQPNAPEDDTSRAIAGHIVEFLKHEVNHGRLPKSLLPIQSGIGNIANAVIGGLSKGENFSNLKVWTEVLQDSFLDLFDSGHLDFATATSIRFSPDGFQRFYKGWEGYHNKLLLRSQQVSNNPEIIRRLGVIGMNTPVEVDIYAHANSTCVMGSRMLNGSITPYSHAPAAANKYQQVSVDLPTSSAVPNTPSCTRPARAPARKIPMA